MAPTGPKMLNTNNRALWWVPTIANRKSPTAAEVTAGVQLTCLVTVANYQFGITGTAIVVDPSPCDDIEAGAPGMDTVEAGFDMFRFKDDVEDIAWTTFTDKGIGGFLVERIGQVADGEDPSDVPITTGDEVSVMQVLTLSPRPLSPATAGYEKFNQSFAPQGFTARAVVAAA
ncbi:hypothetical protein [Glutamicibacter arilaitensis]|uniref:phage tail tube protein n=1 Tax=Glutamicibacter arilaitensis TaxID=256701 RepID=UPI003850693F